MSMGGETLGVAVLELATDQAALDAGLAKAEAKSDASLGRMTKGAKKSAAEMGTAMGRGAETGAARMDAAFAATAKKTGAVGHTMSRNLTVPLLAIGVGATKMAADFDAAMERVHTQSGAAQKEVDTLRGKVLDLAKSGKVSAGPTELANALYRLEGAGLRGAKAMDALKASAELAAIGNANVEDTAKTLAQTWFVGIKGAGNFKDTVAELNATVGAGDLRLQQLVDGLGTGVLGAAKLAGLGLHDVTGALAVFGDETNNVSGWSAQFATALHFITNPTTKASAALETMHLKQYQLSADLNKPNGLVVALKTLKSHLEALPGGLEGTDAKATLGAIFPGGRGRVMTILMNQLDRLQMKERQIARTHNQFGGDLVKTQETAQFKIHAAWAKIEADAVDLGHAIGPTLVGAGAQIADEADKIATAFSKLPKGTQEAIVKGGLLVAGIGPALKLLSVFTKGVGTLYKVATIGDRIAAKGAATGGLKASQSVGTMEVGTLIAKAMVGGAGGGAGPVAADNALRDGKKAETVVEDGLGAKGGASLLSRAKLGGLRLLGRGANGLLIYGISQAAGQIVGGKGGHEISSAGKGAAFGSLFGPEGTAAGAAFGAIYGLGPGGKTPGTRAAATAAANAKLGGKAAKAYADAYQQYLDQHIGTGRNRGGLMTPAVAAAARKAGQDAAQKFGQGMDGGAKPKFPHIVQQGFDDMRKGTVRTVGQMHLDLDHDMAIIAGMMGKHSKAAHNAVATEFGAAITDLGRSMAKGKLDVSDGMGKIEDLVNRHTGASRQVTSQNFRLAAQAIKAAMDSGQIAVQKGTKLINGYMVAAFTALGVDPKTAKLLVKVGAKPGAVHTANPGSGMGHQQKARGGLVQFGRAGDAGPDTIPVQLMVGSGEVGAIFNRHQLPEANARFADVGGLAGFFGRNRKRHNAATGGLFHGHPMPHAGVAKAASDVLKQFPGLSVTATTDGNHVPGSYHYKGEAVDMASGDYGYMDKAAGWIKSSGLARKLTEGIHNPNLAVKFGQVYKGQGPFGAVWAGHANHIHIALAGALAGKFGATAQRLARVIVEGPDSPLKTLAQTGLDAQRSAAQQLVDAAAANMGGGTGGGDTGGGLVQASGNGAALMKKIAAARGWNFDDWWALDGAETSHGANLGHLGTRAQFLPENQGKYGPGSTPGSSEAQQLEAMAEYIDQRYGNPTKAWAQYYQHPGGVGWYSKGGLTPGYAPGGVVANAATAAPPGEHWVRGHWETRGGKRFWVKGHYAHNPRYGGHNPASRGGTGGGGTGHIPAKSKKLKKPKFPKMPKVRPVQPFGLKGYDFPELAYKWLAGVMGEGPRGLAAMIEAEGNQSTVFDRTDEQFIVTNPDGSSSIDQDAVNQRISELTSLIGMESPIQALTGQAATMLPQLRAKAEKAREHYRNQVKRIKQRVRDNLRRIKQLRAKVANEKKKQHPNLGHIGDWQKQIAKLEGENLALTGQADGTGDGGDLKVAQAHATAFNNALSNIGDWRTSLVGISGTGGTQFDVSSTMYDLTSQLGQLSPDALAKALAQAGGSTGGGASALDALKAQAYDQLVAAQGVEKVQNAIFSGLSLAPIPGLPPFAGTFHTGGTIPGPVGAERMALVQAGERITEIGGDSATVVEPHLHFRPGTEWLKDFVDVRMEQRSRRTARNAGQRRPSRGGRFS